MFICDCLIDKISVELQEMASLISIIAATIMVLFSEGFHKKSLIFFGCFVASLYINV